jgi:CDP-diglyceride synthetase
MAELVPAIHVLTGLRQGKTWMPGSSPGMTVEGFVLVLMDLVAWH